MCYNKYDATRHRIVAKKAVGANRSLSPPGGVCPPHKTIFNQIRSDNIPAKTKVDEVPEANPEKEERGPLLEALRKVLLAGIGAVVIAQEEIEDLVNKLVERGEIAEKDGKKLVREVMDKRKKGAEKAEDEFTKRIEEILDRMNVPTKADIDSLGEKIAALTKKVDELKKSQS